MSHAVNTSTSITIHKGVLATGKDAEIVKSQEFKSPSHAVGLEHRT